MNLYFKFLVGLTLLMLSPKKTFSQIQFTVDSLKISKVMWISRSDEVIEDFAYGPHIHIVSSIKNVGDDTIVIKQDSISMTIDFNNKKYSSRQLFISQHQRDSILTILPDSILQIHSETSLFFMDGENVIQDNYLFVNFLSQISRLIKKAVVRINVGQANSYQDRIRNCFSDYPFFVDETFSRSIIDY